MTLGVLLTGNEVVVAGTSVGDDAVEVALAVEDDAVGTRGAARVNVEAVENREFKPGACSWESEALVVLILVRILVGSWVKGSQ